MSACHPSLGCVCPPLQKHLLGGTHVFSFWEGMPEQVKRSITNLVSRSKTADVVAVVQKAIRVKKGPVEYMRSLGLPKCMQLLEGSPFPVQMDGSKRGFQAYIFKRQRR